MNRLRPTTRDRGGFTLIELAVCLLLVLVLCVTLAPTVRLGILESSRAACRDHLRELGAGNLAWADDHLGWLVLHPSSAEGSPIYSSLGFLNNQLRLMYSAQKLGTNGYVRNPQFWHCPSDAIDAGDTPSYTSTSYDVAAGEFHSDGNVSYVYVAGHNALTTGEDPGLAPVLADESNQRENGALTPFNMPPLADGDNHGAGFRNVLYLDGHVTGLEGPESVNAIWNGLVNSYILQSID